MSRSFFQELVFHVLILDSVETQPGFAQNSRTVLRFSVETRESRRSGVLRNFVSKLFVEATRVLFLGRCCCHKGCLLIETFEFIILGLLSDYRS